MTIHFHRPALGTCAGCLFYKPIENAGGECRHDAPRLYLARYSEEGGDRAVWPPVDPSDWCGQYVQDAKLALDADERRGGRLRRGRPPRRSTTDSRRRQQ